MLGVSHWKNLVMNDSICFLILSVLVLPLLKNIPAAFILQFSGLKTQLLWGWHDNGIESILLPNINLFGSTSKSRGLFTIFENVNLVQCDLTLYYARTVVETAHFGSHTQTNTNKETGTYKDLDADTDTSADNDTGKYADTYTHRHTKSQRHRHIQTDWQKDWQTDRKILTLTKKQTDKPTQTATEIWDRYCFKYCWYMEYITFLRFQIDACFVWSNTKRTVWVVLMVSGVSCFVLQHCFVWPTIL